MFMEVYNRIALKCGKKNSRYQITKLDIQKMQPSSK